MSKVCICLCLFLNRGKRIRREEAPDPFPWENPSISTHSYHSSTFSFKHPLFPSNQKKPANTSHPEHGPYDGVMNFSQGCSLVSSLLLYQQAQQPSQPPLFKVAIFICGGVPLDVVEELGVNVTQEARDWDSSSKAQLEARASSAAILREGRERWGAGFDSLDSVPSSSSSEAPTTAPTNIFGIDFSLVKPELRIRIPTVHVYGARDPRFPASVTLAHFCDSSMRRTFDHGAGHEIPRARPVSERLAELLEWAAMMADRW